MVSAPQKRARAWLKGGLERAGTASAPASHADTNTLGHPGAPHGGAPADLSLGDGGNEGPPAGTAVDSARRFPVPPIRGAVRVIEAGEPATQVVGVSRAALCRRVWELPAGVV